MRIEKLNEDKIRIFLDLEDLQKNDIDFHSFMSNSIESQELFLDMLDKAEEEVGFITDDCKIMIEALAISNGSFVLTVTKVSKDKSKGTYKKKRINYRRKSTNLSTSKCVYCFNSFDEFCELCKFLNSKIFKYANSLIDSVSLYEYNDKYYLVCNNLNMNVNLLKSFYACVSEFAKYVTDADLFESKLLEYGKLIIKDNAIDICIKHFC